MIQSDRVGIDCQVTIVLPLRDGNLKVRPGVLVGELAAAAAGEPGGDASVGIFLEHFFPPEHLTKRFKREKKKES